MAFPTDLTEAVDGLTNVLAAHINNLEAKIGIDNSAVVTSLDYLVKTAVDPGHTHTTGGGAGDVIGPGSAVNSNFAAFDTTTGKLIKDSGNAAADFEPADSAIQTAVAIADDLVTLSGVSANAESLGSFTGSLLGDTETIKSALQDIETAIQGVLAPVIAALPTGTVPSLAGARAFTATPPSAVTITNFADKIAGAKYTIYIKNGNTTLDLTTRTYLFRGDGLTGPDMTFSAGDEVTLSVGDGGSEVTVWWSIR